MAVFKSQSHLVSKPIAEVSKYVAIPSNLIELLPADRVENWKTEGDRCSFKIKGLAHISLKLKSSTPDEVIYGSDAEKPFPFEMVIMFRAVENNTQVNAEFRAEVNSFFATMLNGPMSKFLDHLGRALSTKFA